MSRGVPNRRRHGCDVCYDNVPTECFLGFNRNVLWVCGNCYNLISHGIERKHQMEFNERVEAKK